MPFIRVLYTDNINEMKTIFIDTILKFVLKLGVLELQDFFANGGT